MPTLSSKTASLGLIIGCIVFGLGSVIVARLHMGAYAVAFWRLAVAAVIFALLMRFFAQKLPKNPRAVGFALLSGVFLAFDLALWHESIYAVGPGISTLLNCLQIFWLSMMGVLWFQEKLGRRQIASLALALVGIAVIGSPEFGHNSHALWGFVSGIASGLMLSLSMVFIRKTHQAEPTALFALMLLVSIGGMAALVAPALTLNASNALPTTAAQIGWMLRMGADCLLHSAAVAGRNGLAAAHRAGCRAVHRFRLFGQTDFRAAMAGRGDNAAGDLFGQPENRKSSLKSGWAFASQKPANRFSGCLLLQNLQSVARRRLTDVAINKALLNKPFGDEPSPLRFRFQAADYCRFPPLLFTRTPP